MQRSLRSVLAASIRLILVVGMSSLLIGLAGGQTEGVLPFDPLNVNDKITIQKLRDGKEPFGPAHKEVIERVAKFYANRFTWPEYQAPAKSDKEGMHILFMEASQIIVRPTSDAQQQYMSELSKAMVGNLKRVVRNVQPITRINGARVLALLAWAGQEEASDALLEVIKEPNESDAVKLYALRGFKDLFELKQPSKEREAGYIQALVQYLEPRTKVPAGMPPEEAKAVRYVRREAVRALGQTRYPMVEGAAPTALLLLRIACRDASIQPTPNLAEQVEAAIGVCQLDPKLTKDYNADYVAQMLAWFVVDFTSAYNNRASLAEPNTGYSYPWKLYALRLREAFDKLQANAADLPTKGAVDAIAGQAELALDVVEQGRTPKPEALEQWLRSNKVANDSVFKSQAESKVAPALAAN
jgi:hypothetical protein